MKHSLSAHIITVSRGALCSSVERLASTLKRLALKPLKAEAMPLTLYDQVTSCPLTLYDQVVGGIARFNTDQDVGDICIISLTLKGRSPPHFALRPWCPLVSP
jgi:hypothetical protein